ncbi:hypothetical protein SSE37_05817 [Sagittula stellata E-37]|uniref:Uncharacterized protein n=1 Tax=Sagittula stellata (strain ATCC 700073 / DSM 11524 / E-37) TaxID=388399 RepID=A3K9K4_SAGS3|nr:hypothetical protein SSE37_05817 [Sagittula stellata E-37]
MALDEGGEAFVHKDSVADYFERYTTRIQAPVPCGVEVRRVSRLEGRTGFRFETTHGVYEAQSVVSVTGPFQVPVIPPVIPKQTAVQQIHSADYRSPDALPQGAVLVVGAGSSGVQIADELNIAGRKVYLSVGPHDRPPRRYRGRDFVWWLGVLGKWDMAAPAPGTDHVTIAVSGARGGETADFRRLAHDGLTLVGRTESCEDGVLRFAPDLIPNIARGDANLLSLLDEADAYVTANGLDLPEEPEARVFPNDPDCMTNPLTELNLSQAGVGTVIWATGYALDYNWLDVDVLDDTGKPRHQRGVSSVRGLYYVGLPWLSRRGSSFIWGVWHDVTHVADQIAIQSAYETYDAQAGGLGAAEE